MLTAFRLFFNTFITGARTYRTYDAAFMALCSNMQQQVLDCKRKADYMTLVRRVLRQSRTLPLPLGMPTDLRQARKDLVRESGVFLNDNLHRMGEQKINFLFFEVKYLTVLTYFIFFFQILSRGRQLRFFF